MGNAKFYYYPMPNGAVLKTIDMGESLGELFSDFEVDASDGVSMNGGIFRSVGRSGEVVTIQRDRMILGEDLARKFVALQNHLDRGFSCAFASDSDKAWAAPLRYGPTANTGALSCFANPFRAAVGSNVVAANDYIVLETQPPAMLHEIAKIDSATLSAAGGGSIALNEGVNFHYRSGPPVFARYYRFWPILKRPAADVGRNIITNEGGRLFSLSLRLVPDYSTLFAYHPVGVNRTQVETGILGGTNTPADSPGGPRGGLDAPRGLEEPGAPLDGSEAMMNGRFSY